ncbi:MAG: hypothetical protein WA213_19460 [Terriglobales bacterium]
MTIVDFVARGEAEDEWKMVLVEQGPWAGPIDDQLRRLQERLYGTIDAALDGQLAEQFPESRGKKLIVQLDAYNVPRAEVSEFFDRFSEGVLSTADYRQALKNNQFVKGITFELNFESIN